MNFLLESRILHYLILTRAHSLRDGKSDTHIMLHRYPYLCLFAHHHMSLLDLHARTLTHIHTHTHTHGQGNVCQERWHARGGSCGRRDVGRCGRFLCVDVWDGTRAGGRGALPMAVGACMHVCISRCCEWSLARMVPLIFFLALSPPVLSSLCLLRSLSLSLSVSFWLSPTLNAYSPPWLPYSFAHVRAG